MGEAESGVLNLKGHIRGSSSAPTYLKSHQGLLPALEKAMKSRGEI